METDTELESLTTVIKKGWPENLVALSPLSVLTSFQNAVVFKGERIVVQRIIS